MRLPNRTELGPRVSRLTFAPVDLDAKAFGALHLAGAWELTSDDPRFGGISALAVNGQDVVALTDSGALVRFAKPGRNSGSALLRELPAGPGDRRFKSQRDSEALVQDSAKRGWWIAFENRNEIWRYDSDFHRPLERLKLGRKAWPKNRGIEAAALAEDGLLLFPENGESVVELRGGWAQAVKINNPAGRISDATRLPTGQLLVINRSPTLLGFANSIAALDRTAEGYRYGPRLRLGVSRLDNVEAVAAEALPGGRVRLWLMTDDNFQRPLRTLLIALDVGPTASL